MSKWKRTGIVRSTEFQTREADGKRYIDGYFALFNSEYRFSPFAFETIDPGAFDLNRDSDVRALTNHDTTLVLGRTTAGTLQLQVDERGLWGSILINENDQDAVNAYERVRRGDVNQCSFGFNVLRDDVERGDDGQTVWHLEEVELFEVSVCTFPASPETSIDARAADLDAMKQRDREIWRAEALARVRGETPEEETKC